MNRLLKFLYRFQNQRRIHTQASFWTVVKMAWRQSASNVIVFDGIEIVDIEDLKSDNDSLVDDNYAIIDLNLVK